MKVFDCFPFLNEYEILELRLMELNDIVDYFVSKWVVAYLDAIHAMPDLRVIILKEVEIVILVLWIK